MKEMKQAYEACLYRVFLPQGPVDVRVGEPIPALDAWLEAWGCTCWAILTAHNPRSRWLTAAENQQRQFELEQSLRELGLFFLPGENMDPKGHWPLETACLILDLSLADAESLAQRFEQNAFLWAMCGEKAGLVWSESI